MSIESVDEYVATNIPYAKEVHTHFRQYGIYVDTRSELLLSNLKLAYKLNKEGMSSKDILSHLGKKDISVGTWVYCNDEEYGLGRVTSMLNDDMMTVMFNARKLNTICNSKNMITIHDNKPRKLKVIYV